MSTFYDILCIAPKASDQEIRKAYRMQVMLYHPDKNPSPEAIARFFLITQAYDTLIDKNKRFLYDHNLGEFATSPYYMPSYEEWMEERIKKQQEEKALELQIFLEKKKLFQNKPYYSFRILCIYTLHILGYGSSAILFILAIYIISISHFIVLFVLLPLFSGSVFLAYLSYTWFNHKRSLFK